MHGRDADLGFVTGQFDGCGLVASGGLDRCVGHGIAGRFVEGDGGRVVSGFGFGVRVRG